MCPHTTVYVSSYYYMCPRTSISVLVKTLLQLCCSSVAALLQYRFNETPLDMRALCADMGVEAGVL